MRPPTPFVDEKGESKGWNELLGHEGWSFRSQLRQPLEDDEVVYNKSVQTHLMIVFVSKLPCHSPSPHTLLLLCVCVCPG